MEKIQWIIAIVSLIAGSGALIILKKVIKEFRDVMEKFKIYNEDKTWTDQEKTDFIEEVKELILELLNLYSVVKKLIPNFKK